MAGETIDEFKKFPLYSFSGKVMSTALYRSQGQECIEMTIFEPRSMAPVIIVADQESDCFEECKEIPENAVVRVSGRMSMSGPCQGGHNNHIALIADRIRIL